MVSPEGHGSAGGKEKVGVASPSHTIESRMLGDELATGATQGYPCRCIFSDNPSMLGVVVSALQAAHKRPFVGHHADCILMQVSVTCVWPP
jgi:hypothetical protein